MLVPKRNQSPLNINRKYFKEPNVSGRLNKMLYVDTKTWLPDGLLIKADKITMANSVELRVHFLDHKVTEFAANVPEEFKVRGRKKKYKLKETFRGILPSEILDREKTGFPVPYENWIHKDHAAIIRDVLLDDSTLRRCYFKRKGIEWILNKNRIYNIFSKEIFSLFVLEVWHRIFYDNRGTYVSI